MKFRLAKENELPQVANIYERILDDEEAGRVAIGWERDVYPTLETAQSAFSKGSFTSPFRTTTSSPPPL